LSKTKKYQTVILKFFRCGETIKCENYCILSKLSDFVLTGNVGVALGKLGSNSAPNDETVTSSEQQEHTQTSFDSDDMFNGM
jgi:hypothetical protein